MNFKPNQIANSIALAVCGLGLTYLFWTIAEECPKFEQGTDNKQRPILTVIKTFWLAFVVYFVAWLTAGGWNRRCSPSSSTIPWLDLGIVFSFGLVFRVVLTPTAPIQEIDLYRYVWDGAVFANQLDPYYYGPETVLRAVHDERYANQNERILPYVEIVRARPGLQGILETIHYGTYTSPYPPVSQFFFGVSVATVSKSSGKLAYIRAMKALLVVFDVAIAIFVALLLFHVGMNPTLVLTYFWCPLVLKEIANGGHLDSIATCFAVACVYFATRAVWQRQVTIDLVRREAPSSHSLPVGSLRFALLSSVALAAGFAAKVFPLVLGPIWFVVILRTGLRAIVSLLVFAVAAFLFSAPMLKHLTIAQNYNLVSEAQLESLEDADPSGIEAFSKYWEMNDFLFMLIVENLKPDVNPPINDFSRTPWFRCTSNSFRETAIEKIQPWLDSEADEAAGVQYGPSNYAFFATRCITLAVFCGIVLWGAATLLRKPEPRRWLEWVFLILAWFWLLSPTQNPWYWTWSLPFLVFARGTTWVFLSGFLFAYYSRFWFEYQYKSVDVMRHWKTVYGDAWYYDWLFPMADRFGYQGTTFYDFYIPILEFGPWFAVLLVAWLVRRFSWSTDRSVHAANPHIARNESTPN